MAGQPLQRSSRRRACCGCGSRSASGRPGRFLARSRRVTSAGEPGRERPAGQAEHPRRVRREERHELRQLDEPGPDEPVEAQRAPPSPARRCRTPPGRTRPSCRRTVCGAWSVAMQSIVPSRSPSSTAARSASRAQRRVHLGVGVVARLAHGLVGQEQVVRRGLGGDPHAAGLAAAHRVHRGGGREVGDVDAAAGELGQQHVALDHDRLAARPAAPRRPSSVATGPSFMHAFSASVGSSQWSISARSKACAYSRARRIMRALATGLPSSENATQPASCRSPYSASSSPLWPRVMAPIG